MTVFILLLAIFKRLKLQKPDCIHFEDNLTKFIFFFKLVIVLEDEISLIEGVGILIGKVVEPRRYIQRQGNTTCKIHPRRYINRLSDHIFYLLSGCFSDGISFSHSGCIC